jgi:hypothetical protein
LATKVLFAQLSLWFQTVHNPNKTFSENQLLIISTTF